MGGTRGAGDVREARPHSGREQRNCECLALSCGHCPQTLKGWLVGGGAYLLCAVPAELGLQGGGLGLRWENS